MSSFDGRRSKPRHGEVPLSDGSTLGRYEAGADPTSRERLRLLVGGLRAALDLDPKHTPAA